ncbi:subtilisin-like protein [Xylaria digitata]|nr:subtilisin-like protein [Xylaria digitata]
MAKIIRAIDPCCDLFMAKVADHRRSITIEAVVKALTRVTKDEVDVISMSFTLDNKSPSLETAIVQASKKGIVLLCSTADEGENRAHAWPASFSEALAIAACSDAGEKLLTSTTEAQYYFRGENVLYDSVRGGNSSVEKISGSSVATAIAAGVASLCLACCRIDNTEVPNGSKKVAELFDKAKEGKYVRPWVLFGETRRGDSDPMFL